MRVPHKGYYIWVDFCDVIESTLWVRWKIIREDTYEVIAEDDRGIDIHTIIEPLIDELRADIDEITEAE